ncbi:MAG TPA: SRPBCC family protein [Bacteroidia bacterium]|nr:SRPBCC family protein [Bacteroidia bacterium]
MQGQLKKSYTINAPKARVWEALTNPRLIKQYFFNTEAVSDWKEGSTIIYRGTWEGKPYEDRAVILKLIPLQELTINFWSSRTGKEDRPENYSRHSYLLEEGKGKTLLTLVQPNNLKNGDTRSKAWQHWDTVIAGLKKVVE